MLLTRNQESKLLRASWGKIDNTASGNDLDYLIAGLIGQSASGPQCCCLRLIQSMRLSIYQLVSSLYLLISVLSVISVHLSAFVCICLVFLLN